ncbi:sugar transporter, partial [Methylobacterium sp. WL9]
MVRIAAPAALLACLASGCSYLPASGPTSRAIVDGADVATPQGVYARYELIDVDPAI